MARLRLMLVSAGPVLVTGPVPEKAASRLQSGAGAPGGVTQQRWNFPQGVLTASTWHA